MVFTGWLTAALATVLAAGEADFRNLFNGKDLDGWVVDGPKEYKDKGQVKPLWQVEDGLISCAGKGFGFLRYDRQQFADFRLHVEYRLAPKGNSGIGIRTVRFDPKKSTQTRPSYACYEVQILDDAGHKADKFCSGSLYRYVAPTSNPVKPSPEWNTMEVECVGPHIRVWVNGIQVQDVDQTTISEIKDKPLKGYVCLQSHTNKVEFRNVRIREIKE